MIGRADYMSGDEDKKTMSSIASTSVVEKVLDKRNTLEEWNSTTNSMVSSGDYIVYNDCRVAADRDTRSNVVKSKDWSSYSDATGSRPIYNWAAEVAASLPGSTDNSRTETERNYSLATRDSRHDGEDNIHAVRSKSSRSDRRTVNSNTTVTVAVVATPSNSASSWTDASMDNSDSSSSLGYCHDSWR